MSKRIRAIYRKAGQKAPNGKGIHTEKFHRCVVDVKKKGGAVNPYAVCMSSIGRTGAVKKPHRKTKSRANALR